MTNSFELEVKNKLTWSSKQWQAEGDKGNGMRRLINSLKYWNGRLHNAMRDNNVILTFYDGEKKVYPSLQKLADSIFSINEQIEIIGYAKFKNKRFISLTFADAIKKDIVIQNLVQIENSKIAYLQWVDETIQQSITVDWLSDGTDLDLTIQYIAQYMEIHSVKREDTVLANGNVCTSGKVFFHGRIIGNIELDDIPHFAYIDGLECLIIAEGRPYKCFTCMNIGHKAAQCTKAYCRNCKAVLGRTHRCPSIGQEMLQQSHLIEQENTWLLEGEEVGVGVSNIREEKVPRENLFLNLFQNDKIATNKEVQNKINTIETLDWPQNIPREEGTADLVGLGKEGLLSDSSDSWFKNGCHEHNLKKSNLNELITEETYVGHPNFVLIDTSSEESDSDSISESNVNGFDEAQIDLSELTERVNLTRSLIDESLNFLKPTIGEKRAVTENMKEKEGHSNTAKHSRFNKANGKIQGKEATEGIPKLEKDIHMGKKSATSNKKKKKNKK